MIAEIAFNADTFNDNSGSLFPILETHKMLDDSCLQLKTDYLKERCEDVKAGHRGKQVVRRDAIPIANTTAEQAFRLVRVLDEIGKLQCEKNILQGYLSRIEGVQVAHGPDFDVVIEEGQVRVAKHAQAPPQMAQRAEQLIDALNSEAPAGKIVNGALQAALIAVGNTAKWPLVNAPEQSDLFPDKYSKPNRGEDNSPF